MKKLFIPIVLILSSLSIKAQQVPEKTITLKLTVPQVNLILSSLGDRKLGESIDTYLAIRMQALTQLTDTTVIKSDTTKVKPKKLPETKSLPH